MFRAKLLILLLAAGLALGMASDAFARAGMGFSMGSRGYYRTYSMPAPTSISPYASPLQRSWTAPSPYSNPLGYGSGFGYPGAFGRGFFGGLMGGFFGAGLLGLLFGHGFYGGLGGGFSFLGLLLQIGLLYLIVRFVLNFFSNRQQPAFYGAPQAGGAYASGGWPGSYGSGSQGTPLPITAPDYDAFERLLGSVQNAYSSENLDQLRRIATPEMASYFAEELEGQAHRGQVNRLSGVKLLQGNLSEAWREGGAEYATVAMRFSLIDVMVDRTSGQIVSGDPNRPDEATELWTFVRPAGSGPDAWKLSAIQQV